MSLEESLNDSISEQLMLPDAVIWSQLGLAQPDASLQGHHASGPQKPYSCKGACCSAAHMAPQWSAACMTVQWSDWHIMLQTLPGDA